MCTFGYRITDLIITLGILKGTLEKLPWMFLYLYYFFLFFGFDEQGEAKICR